MAARLGYGGLANTNGARDFSGKEEAEAEAFFASTVLTVGLHIGLAITLYLIGR